jgi:hypothetical protein
VGSYYYLMAQLPGLMPGSPLPVSYEQFRETASRFLSAKDLAVLESLTLEPPRAGVASGSSLVDQWYKSERALRLALAKLRALRMKRDTGTSFDEEELVSASGDETRIAHTASAIEDPLEAERYLLRCRYGIIDSLRGNHYFDSDAVFAYGLMLLLHERSDLFTADAGRASYATIYNQILGE